MVESWLDQDWHNYGLLLHIPQMCILKTCTVDSVNGSNLLHIIYNYIAVL